MDQSRASPQSSPGEGRKARDEIENLLEGHSLSSKTGLEVSSSTNH
jgi:hypothetical protein